MYNFSRLCGISMKVAYSTFSPAPRHSHCLPHWTHDSDSTPPPQKVYVCMHCCRVGFGFRNPHHDIQRLETYLVTPSIG